MMKELKIKILGIDETSTATAILTAINDAINTEYMNRGNDPIPAVEFHFEEDRPTFRGEETAFDRYLRGTTPNGESV